MGVAMPVEASVEQAFTPETTATATKNNQLGSVQSGMENEHDQVKTEAWDVASELDAASRRLEVAFGEVEGRLVAMRRRHEEQMDLFAGLDPEAARNATAATSWLRDELTDALQERDALERETDHLRSLMRELEARLDKAMQTLETVMDEEMA